MGLIARANWWLPSSLRAILWHVNLEGAPCELQEISAAPRPEVTARTSATSSWGRVGDP
jgi:hypothetical protein